MIFGSDFYVVSHCAEASQPFGLTKSSECYESTTPGEFIALKLLCWAMSLLLLLLLTSCFITLPFSLPFSGGLMHVPGVCLGLSSVLTCPGLQHILCCGSHMNRGQHLQCGWSQSSASAPNSVPLCKWVEHDLVV